jgi:hypothetical protein
MIKKKYRVGKPYKSIYTLLKDLNNDKYVYWCNVVKHPSIIKNMRLDTVENSIKIGIIKKAIKNNLGEK